MQPDPRFADQPKPFWAQTTLLSLSLGYSERVKRGEPKKMRRFEVEEIFDLYRGRGLDPSFLGSKAAPTAEAELLISYLNYRADAVETRIEPMLMDRAAAQVEFEKLRARLPASKVHLPMNKQTGDKAHHSYLTGIVNLLTEQALAGRRFAENPNGPITITKDKRPVRTLARRMDGAYPALNNPDSCWEIKEYYGTTTFGSRVADGIYETMMDGLEIEELEEHTGHRLRHYLIVDDRFTWWEMGRSYLCRIVDMLHTGMVDEALFGREVLTRWPTIVAEWP